MEAARAKLISKRPGKKTASVAAHTELDLAVAKAVFDLQSSSAELGAELRALQFYGAREVDLGTAGRKAIVLVVPVFQIKAWRKIQLRVVRELEKKFSDRAVTMIGYRCIKPKVERGVQVKIQRGARTMTFVHEAWLEDLVYPTEIVGKRLRVKTDGSRLIRVLLDPKDQTALESKVDTLAAVYHKLTGKDIVFEFPLNAHVEEAVMSKNKSK